MRTLAWEWVKFNYPQIAQKIKLIAYDECGLKPPKIGIDPEMAEMLKKI
jgi:hypothetical protein